MLTKTCCSYSIYMGNVEMPMGAPGATLKVPVGTYEFGANLISSKVSLSVCHCNCKANALLSIAGLSASDLQGDMMIGRISNDGRLTGRVK